VQIVSRRHPVRHTVDLAAEIDGDDVGTFFGETYGMRAALAPRGPGDKNDLSSLSGLLASYFVEVIKPKSAAVQ
jgi:hypothetical protein